MIRTYQDLVEEARERISELTAKEYRAVKEAGEEHVCLDVREMNEWNLGRIPGCIHIPRGQLESRIEALLERDVRIIVYCANGNRSALAADTLRRMGYEKAASISDGWTGWIYADGEVEGL